MNILYITTVGLTMSFFKTFIAELIESGHRVDIACNEDSLKLDQFYRDLKCKIHHIETSRNPYSKGNIKAIGQIKKLVSSTHYDIVHCHTPVAAACARLACRKARKTGTKVFYTVHGFHFYKGAPLKNWMLYYPVEKLCSIWTDILITINQEDLRLAQNKLKAKRVEYVPGVGIDLNKFSPNVISQIEKEELRKSLGILPEDKILLSVGELNPNKNHEAVIKALAKINDPSIHYIIAGEGPLKEYLENSANSLGVGKQVHLVGFIIDTAGLYNIADIFCFPSYREGLPVSLMEAMASGLPCAASKVRGNIDLLRNVENEFLFAPTDIDEITIVLRKLISDRVLCSKLGRENMEEVKDYSKENVLKCMYKLYDLH